MIMTLDTCSSILRIILPGRGYVPRHSRERSSSSSAMASWAYKPAIPEAMTPVLPRRASRFQGALSSSASISFCFARSRP